MPFWMAFMDWESIPATSSQVMGEACEDVEGQSDVIGRLHVWRGNVKPQSAPLRLPHSYSQAPIGEHGGSNWWLRISNLMHARHT